MPYGDSLHEGFSYTQPNTRRAVLSHSRQVCDNQLFPTAGNMRNNLSYPLDLKYKYQLA
jgi:hypothetical protein